VVLRRVSPDALDEAVVIPPKGEEYVLALPSHECPCGRDGMPETIVYSPFSAAGAAVQILAVGLRKKTVVSLRRLT
jgi:hypothetical protein